MCDRHLAIIGSDNSLSPGRHQDIVWANAGILLIGPIGTNFGEMLIEIRTVSFKKMHLSICQYRVKNGAHFDSVSIDLLIDIPYFVNSWRVHA